MEQIFTLMDREKLPFDGDTYEFEGQRFRNTKVSFIWVDMPPGGSVRLHKHPYEEVFIIEEGKAIFSIDAQTIEAHSGQIIIVPKDTAHKFGNSGDGRL